jgi:phenylacetate-CoA ligase
VTLAVRGPAVWALRAYTNRMFHNSYEDRRRLEALDGEALARHQLGRLNALLDAVLPSNAFYAEKLRGVSLPLPSLDAWADAPFTFKEELIADSDSHDWESGDWAANHTFAEHDYQRFHHTSGTRGRPLIVLDTATDWQWWLEAWQFVLDTAEITAADRALLAFSFGPFIGFWSAHDALIARGSLVVPSGGLSTLSRLELLRTSRATVLLCTPTYALHLAETARNNRLPMAEWAVRVVIVAGETGGSSPEVRGRIEEAFGARVVDHAGATEVGPWGYGDAEGRGIYVNESEFIAEFLSVETGEPAGDGELAELVLTTLGRAGCPVLRYRTGDLVRPDFSRSGANRFVHLPGGVLGRADDMLVIRGVNIFPSSIDQILRSFPEVVEYRMTAFRRGEMDALRVEVEDRLGRPERIARELKLRLGLNIEVTAVEPGALPRSEGKGKRFVDKRPR